MNLGATAISACIFLAVTTLVGTALVWLTGGDERTARRLDELADGGDMPLWRRPGRLRSGRTGTMLSIMASLGARLIPSASDSISRVHQQLVHAGVYVPIAPRVFFAVRGFMVTAPLLVGGLGFLTDQLELTVSMLLIGAGGVAGLLLPELWLRMRVQRRQNALRASLPDFMDLIVACLEAGQSLEASLQRVTSELRTAHPELAFELGIVQREMALSTPPHRAVRNLATRTGLDVLRTLSTLIDQAQRYGCSMTESLRTHAEMLRLQREQRAETQAHKAAVKILFPTLLFIFPPILVTLAGPAAIDVYEKFCEPSSRQTAQNE